MKRLIRRMLLSVIALLFAVAMPACSTNPATGKRQFNIISTDREIALGAESSPQFLKAYGGDIPSAGINAFVTDLGNRLAAVSERAELPWEFHVVDSPVINAFALPGGKVFMSRGLLAKMTNEAQLAGVLGHEIGHVTAQHVGQQMSRAVLVQGIGIGIGIAGQRSDSDWMQVLGVGAAAGGTLYLLKYGRDQESQADELGLRYMTKIGYNPAAQIQVMKLLKEAAGSSGGRPPEWMSTHPLPDTRIKRLYKMIRERYPDYQDVNKYQFHVERFKQQVVVPLAKLPPPKHDPKKQQEQQKKKQLQRSRYRRGSSTDQAKPPVFAMVCDCPHTFCLPQ